MVTNCCCNLHKVYEAFCTLCTKDLYRSQLDEGDFILFVGWERDKLGKLALGGTME